MIDTLESGAVTPEQGNLPSSGASTEQHDKLTSGGQDIRDIVKGILKDELGDLDGQIERKTQSVKDKRFSDIQRVQDEQQSTLERITELVGSGMDFPTALTQAENEERYAFIDNLRQERLSPKQSVGNAPKVSDNLDAVLDAFNLTTTDPRVQSALSGKTGADALLAAVELGKKIKSNPPASTAQIAASPGGPPPPRGDFTEMSDDALGEKLMELSAINPRYSKVERAKIRAELDRRNPTKILKR